MTKWQVIKHTNKAVQFFRLGWLPINGDGDESRSAQATACPEQCNASSYATRFAMAFFKNEAKLQREFKAIFGIANAFVRQHQAANLGDGLNRR
jgi:hypothetical protein